MTQRSWYRVVDVIFFTSFLFASGAKSLSGYDRRKYVWKLLYCFMLGYTIDFGHIQAVNLCSCAKYSEKAAGYLACSLLLHEEHDILRLIVNVLRTDIANPTIPANEPVVALALNTIGNIGGIEFAENLFGDICRLIAPGVSPYIKRKALICILRLYRKDTELITVEVPDNLLWVQRFQMILRENDVGVLLSGLGLLLGILEDCVSAERLKLWGGVLDDVVHILRNIVLADVGNGPIVKREHTYYTVKAPWLQVKLLRVLQFFPPRLLAESYPNHLRFVNECLFSVLTGNSKGVERYGVQPDPAVPGSAVGGTHLGTASSSASKRGGRKADAERINMLNTQNSVLFEAINLVIHLENFCTGENQENSIKLLGSFISAKEANIRYLGLETMSRLALSYNRELTYDPASSSDGGPSALPPALDERINSYTFLILSQMHEADISIRRQALKLLYSICSAKNWQAIVHDLLQILSQVSAHGRAAAAAAAAVSGGGASAGSDTAGGGGSLETGEARRPVSAADWTASFQEELVLRIAIIAEKNAPDGSWYLDAVFRMIESAPGAVDEGVWHRVVQVVTGDSSSSGGGGGGEELQRYAATKAYAALSEGYCHGTMVKLGSYLLGEFGHECQDISVQKQFSAIHRHYVRQECEACRPGMLLAFAKILNGKQKKGVVVVM